MRMRIVPLLSLSPPLVVMAAVAAVGGLVLAEGSGWGSRVEVGAGAVRVAMYSWSGDEEMSHVLVVVIAASHGGGGVGCGRG